MGLTNLRKQPSFFVRAEREEQRLFSQARVCHATKFVIFPLLRSSLKVFDFYWMNM